VLVWYTVINMTRCFGTKKQPQPFSRFAYKQCNAWNTKKLNFLCALMLSHKKVCIFNLVGFPRCLGTQQLRCKYRRVAQRDRWTVTLYQKHFDLGKTRCATTDYVTWKTTVDVCNCIAYVAHDWHRSVDKLTIFIQRCCAFFVQRKVSFSTGANFLLLDLWTL